MADSRTFGSDGTTAAAENADQVLAPFRSKADLVYDLIRGRIVTGFYPPGHRLVVARIAREVGTSPIPVREALNRLQAEGLVHIRPHVGTTVAQVDLDSLSELFQVRLELESFATRLAAELITEATGRALQKLLILMRERLERDDTEGYEIANNRFHRLIYAASGNRTLARLIDDLWARSERSRSAFRLIPGQMERSWKEHRDILQALLAGDGERAESLMRSHKERAFKLLLREMGSKNKKVIQRERWKADVTPPDVRHRRSDPGISVVSRGERGDDRPGR